MKKILISLSIIGIAAAVVIGGTMAYFNDTETSTGNVFTAGSIDLKVDHLAQTYNGMDCNTASVMIKSDTTNLVTATVNGNDPIAFSHNAVPVTSTWITDAYWTHAIPDATWVWATDPVTQNDSDNTVTYTFEKTFEWHGPVTDASMTLGVAADNNYAIYLNGNSVAADNSGGNSASVDDIPSANISPWIQEGVNTLRIDVTNLGQPSLPIVNNPAGLLYKLAINGNPTGDYFKAHCQLWNEQDLTGSEHFWDINDVKPGDHGTNVISLHVTSNDAYACLITNNIDDQENDIVDPETTAGDLPNVGNLSGYGELSPFIKAFAWDDDGDGVYEGETIFSGQNVPLSTAIGTITLPTSSTKNIGIAWCAGTQSVAGNVISCDGASMGNIAQTDSFTADVTAYAVQQRNNDDFICAGVNLPEQGDNGESLGPDIVNLLSANNFAVVAETLISDVAPYSTITGNIAINPAAGSSISDLSCTSMLGGGKIYNDGGYTGGHDANIVCEVVSPATALAARSAMETAYTDAAGRIPGTGASNFNVGGGTLSGQNFTPGTYTWDTNVIITDDITLTGDGNDVWIFQISGTLNLASGKKIKLAGGALAKNIFWQVTGATTLGTNSTFNGTILDQTNIAIQTGAVLNGRALAQTAVTLDANIITLP